MPEPLSDEDVRRIARETTRQTVRRLAETALLLGATVAAVLLLPAMAGYAIGALAPATGEQGNPLFGVILVAAMLVVAAILVRTWRIVRR